MIAAVSRRIRAVSERVDRGVDRLMQRAWGPLVHVGRRMRRTARGFGRRLRPLGALLFRGLALLERRLLWLAARARRAALWGSGVLTPWRAICLATLGAAGCLLVSQFVDYHAIQVGQAGYAGLPGASAPTIDAEAAGQAHAYLLVPVALLAGALALIALRNERRRGLGRVVFALGLLGLAVALLVDLPAGLDVGAEASRFAGAKAVLDDGFYAEIAACAGLMLGGMLLANANRVRTGHGYRLRKPSLARTQGGRRRARTTSA